MRFVHLKLNFKLNYEKEGMSHEKKLEDIQKEIDRLEKKLENKQKEIDRLNRYNDRVAAFIKAVEWGGKNESEKCLRSIGYW